MQNESQPITGTSRFSYAATIAEVTKAIHDGGGTVFATLDQSAAAASVGLTLRPTTLLIFGNPRGGTLLMDSAALVGLELPLKMLIWEDASTVRVAYDPLARIAERYGVTGRDEVVATLQKTLAALFARVTS